MLKRKENKMKDYIKDVLVQLHKEVSVDIYGQVGRSNFTPSLFGNKKDEVEKYCRDNRGVLQYSTYGARCGTYKAFTIESIDIRLACSNALRSNKNYIRNINKH